MASTADAVATANSRSPSPAPNPPPKFATPGRRATLLQDVFNYAIAHTLKTCSYSNFATCFPTPAQHVPEALDGLHRDFISRLEEVCKHEFAAILEERAVLANLNELDSLVADATKRKQRAEEEARVSGMPMAQPTPPHLQSPSSLLTAHLNDFLSSQANELNSRLEATQKQNRDLADDIVSQRAEIKSLVEGLEGVIRDLEAAVGSLEAGQKQVIAPSGS